METHRIFIIMQWVSLGLSVITTLFMKQIAIYLSTPLIVFSMTAGVIALILQIKYRKNLKGE